MSAAELRIELSRRGIELTVLGGELRYRAPKGALTAELRASMTALKSDLLAILPAHARCSRCGEEGLRAWLTEREDRTLWCPRCLYAEAEQALRRRGGSQ